MDKSLQEAIGAISTEPTQEEKAITKEDINKDIELTEFDLNKILASAINKYEDLNIPDDMTAKEILNSELEIYDCDKRVPGYGMVQYVINNATTAGFTSKPTYPELRKWLAAQLDIKEKQVDFHINVLIHGCDFSKAKYIPIFAKLDKGAITAQYFVEQFLDYLFA